MTSSRPVEAPLIWNVAGLLGDDPGAERILEVADVTIDLGDDLRLAEPVAGRVRLLRTIRGVLAFADALRQERSEKVFLSATDCPSCLKERGRTNDPTALCQEHLAEALGVGRG